MCVLAARCDDYEGPLFKAATLGALAASLAAALWLVLGDRWLLAPALWVALPPTVGAALGMLAVLATPSWRRLLVGRETLERRVRARAAQAFLDEELFTTRHRTGVLLFVALFERRVEILCDEGVRKLVPEGTWQDVADELARGLRTHQAGPALVAAVEKCGILLEAHGVERREDDVDELSDRPRILDE